MRQPNFFILGAPKCGTTSLARWLSEHSKIYISTYKEPHYFNTDDRRVVDTLAYYQSLFDGAGPEHLAVGEASVWYLSSSAAVANVLDYSPDAKFIVMLRNPLEMAPSLHSELCFNGEETEPNFATAWHLQEERRAGRDIPRSCWAPRRLQYGETCLLGSQLQRLLTRVPRERVLPILLDDLKQDPRREYQTTLKFLGVSDDGRDQFPIHNTAKIRRWPILAQLSTAIMGLKRSCGITGGLGIWSRVDKANRVDASRIPLSPQMKAELSEYFRADIAVVESLLGRNLRHWLV
jgi:Sulfotransferase domain